MLFDIKDYILDLMTVKKREAPAQKKAVILLLDSK